jgi:hypothetical protein
MLRIFHVRPSRAGRALRAAVLLLAVLAATALPAAAEANTVRVSQGVLTYSHTTPQPSSVVTKVVNGAVHVESNDGIQTVSSPCERVSDVEVSCPGVSVQRIDAFLGVGSDSFTSRTSLATRVFGSSGNDEYVGANHALRNRVDFSGGGDLDRVNYILSGGGVALSKDETANDGRFAFDLDNIRGDVERLGGSQHGDILTGSDTSAVERFGGALGNDTMTGNGGPDVFEMGTSADGADRITGGPGIDQVSYAGRTRPVNATLNFGGADDGEAGEGDELLGSNEVIVGGQVGDTIRAPAGSTAAHFLHGLGGIDTLEGADGPDEITGGPQRDTLLGHGDNDRIFANDGEADVVGCGAGTADTAQLDNRDGFESCEIRPAVGTLRLTPKTVVAEAGAPAQVRLSWRHPRAWKQLRAIELRLTLDDMPVGEITIRPRRERITDDGAVTLVRRGTRLTRHGKTVAARLALRLDQSLAGQTLEAEVEATDRRGRRQLERNAGRIRVSG